VRGSAEGENIKSGKSIKLKINYSARLRDEAAAPLLLENNSFLTIMIL
jgi:hypothetical protein